MEEKTVYQGVKAEVICKNIEAAEERKRDAEAAKVTKIAEYLAKKLEREMTRKGAKWLHLTDEKLISPKYLGWKGWWRCRRERLSWNRRYKLEDVLRILQAAPAKFKILCEYGKKYNMYCISVVDNPATTCKEELPF